MDTPGFYHLIPNGSFDEGMLGWNTIVDVCVTLELNHWWKGVCVGRLEGEPNCPCFETCIYTTQKFMRVNIIHVVSHPSYKSHFPILRPLLSYVHQAQWDSWSLSLIHLNSITTCRPNTCWIVSKTNFTIYYVEPSKLQSCGIDRIDSKKSILIIVGEKKKKKVWGERKKEEKK